MILVKSKALEQSIQVGREIGRYGDGKEGPTIVVFAGIHGNEPSGVQALEHVFKTLNKKSIAVKGSVYGILGNIPAILQKQRFVQKDLNRLWLKEEIERIEQAERRGEHARHTNGLRQAGQLQE